MILSVFGTIIYIIFFILIPGAGAITLRKSWREFRRLIFSYSTVPELEYQTLVPGKPFSFKGKLESFKNDDIVWLKGESLSICINLKKQHIYTISSNKEEMSRSRWSEISSIVEGTQFFIFGFLEFIDDIPYLVGSEQESLLVVISENEENIFQRLLKKGRDKNEIWNSYTPYSYITGVLLLIILSYFSYKTNSNKTISYFLLLIAGTPFYFIIPPGLFFYLKYRRIWDISIRWSTLSDLKRLNGDDFSSEKYRVKSKSREKLSLLLYLFGYIMNLIIAGIILFKIFLLIIYS